MVQNVIRTLGGVENYGVISLCLFCAVATGVFIWAMTRARNHLDHMAQLPLEKELETSTHDDNE